MIPTRTADSTGSQAANGAERSTRPTPQSKHVIVASRAMRLVLLACAGLVAWVGWIGVWGLSYRLTHGNAFSYQYLVEQNGVFLKLNDLLTLANTLVPGIEPQCDGCGVSIDLLVYSLILAFTVAGVGYLAGILLLDLGIAAVPGALAVIVFFELVYQVTLFLLPGLYTTDIFSYVMYGQISAIYNLNPYIYPPNYFPGNELLDPAWIHPIWHDQPSVYGPLWTNLSWIIARLTASLSLVHQVFAYKLLMNALQIINLALVWWLLGRLMASRPRARMTGFMIFAWNPVMLFNGPGNAHNDALMVTLLLLGVVPLVIGAAQPSNRAWLAGTFFVGMSALIKYTTGLVGLFYIVPWARRLDTWPARVKWVGGSGVLVIAVTLILFWPWLDFPRALEPIATAATGKSWQYSNSGPDIIALHIDNSILHTPSATPETEDHFYLYGDLYATSTSTESRANMKNVTRAIFALYLLWECWGLWRLAGRRSAPIVEAVLKTSVRAFMVLILLVLPWVLDWYWMWPLALATLLGWRSMLTRVVVAYTLVCLPIFYLHHYWSSNTPSSVIFLYILPPLALPLIAWLYRRITSALRPRADAAELVPTPGLVTE